MAAHEPSQPLRQRIRARTIPCSWCGGQLRHGPCLPRPAELAAGAGARQSAGRVRSSSCCAAPAFLRLRCGMPLLPPSRESARWSERVRARGWTDAEDIAVGRTVVRHDSPWTAVGTASMPSRPRIARVLSHRWSLHLRGEEAQSAVPSGAERDRALHRFTKPEPQVHRRQTAEILGSFEPITRSHARKPRRRT